MAVRGKNLATDVIRPYVAESSVAQVTARTKIAGIVGRAVPREARRAAPELRHSGILPTAGRKLDQLVVTLELRQVVDILKVEDVSPSWRALAP